MAEGEVRARIARDEVERNHILEGVLGHIGKTWLK